MATAAKQIERHVCRETYVECDACHDQEMVDGCDDEDGVAAWCRRLSEAGWKVMDDTLLCGTCVGKLS